MRLPADLPDIAVARVRIAAAPYLAGDVLSLAFTSPAVARLALHDREIIPDDEHAFVPETMTVEIVRAARPFATGELLMLSFVDPRIARILCLVAGAADARETLARDAAVTPQAPLSAAESATVTEPPPVLAGDARVVAAHAPAFASEDSETATHRAMLAPEPCLAPAPVWGAGPAIVDAPAPGLEPDGVRVRIEWKAGRVRQFVQLVDKLFTVDRLGWYRHAFAMRLLVPDAIALPDPHAERAAKRHLRDLRAAAVETLGRPLLAAFMPSFVVTPEWLDSLDLPAAARALAGLREAILPHLGDAPYELRTLREPAHSIGIIERAIFLAAPAGSVEALLPAFIPTLAADDSLTGCLSEYRRTLLELFGQTAQSAEAVRLKQMAQPNHALDDRLWQLVGAVQAAFGELAAV